MGAIAPVMAQLGDGPVDAVETLSTPTVAWAALLPMIVMTVGALLLLTFSSLAKGRIPRPAYALWTVLTAVGSLLVSIPLWAQVQGWDAALGWFDPETDPSGPFSTVAGVIAADGFSVFATILIAICVVLVALLVEAYLDREGEHGPEMFVLVMLAAAGGMVMVAADDLLVLFLGLETLSVAAYVLVAMDLRRVQSQEGGLKYFVLGAFASAIFLYGIAFVYGATGSTRLTAIADFLASNVFLGSGGLLLLLGMGMLLIGFGFKVAAVPFHSWSPDAYDGAPSPIVGFMASVVKVAAFAAMVRVFVVTFSALGADWRPVVQALAVLSLVGGALVAIVQTNVKRLLAYSSISHVGFILLGVEASSDRGTTAVLVYLAAYSVMVLGSFAVVTLVGRRGDGMHQLTDYIGLGRTDPLLAGLFSFFLLAQAGVPFTAGFYAKFTAIIASVDAGSAWLAAIAMLSAAIAAYLYLRLVVKMWFTDPDPAATASPIRVPAAAAIVLGACTVATLWIGLLPSQLTDWADDAEPALVRPAEPAGGGLPEFPGAGDLDEADLEELLGGGAAQPAG